MTPEVLRDRGETVGRAGELEAAGQSLGNLERAISELEPVLRNFVVEG